MPRVDSAAETRRFKPLRPCGKTVPSFQGYSSAGGELLTAAVLPLVAQQRGTDAAARGGDLIDDMYGRAGPDTRWAGERAVKAVGLSTGHLIVVCLAR